MAIKRKTAPKPAARPTPKPLPRPKPAPLDLVRNPNFNAAMAQQNYENLMRDQQARLAARLATERGQSGNQDFIDNRDPNKMYTQDMVDYIDPATGERTSRTRGVVPAPGSRFVRANQAGGLAYNQMPPQGPQVGGGNQDVVDFRRRIYDDLMARQGQLPPPDNATFTPTPQLPPGSQDDIQKFRNAALAGMGERMLTPIPEAPQGAMASQYQNPQGQQQQMQNYQNFLQQGMQNSNTMNQGAMNNFANMQPGMQATQTASRTTPNQTMPVAGMGMQQPKQTPPRKFSTLRNSPARFA